MRILMVLDSLRLGGAERHVVDLSLALRRRGHDVTVACSAGGAFEEHLRGEVPVRVLFEAEIKRQISPAYVSRLRRVVAEGFDAVHAHMFASAVAAATICQPLVITEHSEARWQGRRDRLVNTWACRRAGAVIAVSRPIARRVEGFGVGREKVFVLPNAVPLGPVGAGGRRPSPSCRARSVPPNGVAIHPDDSRRGVLHTPAPPVNSVWISGSTSGRTETELQSLRHLVARAYDNAGGHAKRRPLPYVVPDKARAVVGVVARLVPEKGVQYVLDCLPKVVAAVPDARLLIIGDGPLRDSLETRACAIGVAERIDFAGAVDARPLLPAISVLAVPSLTEGTPLAMLEAMAAGIPVVATAVGGIPDHLHHGVEGLLVAPADATAMGAALIRLLWDGDEARRMGEAGRRRAAQSSHEAMVGRVERIYDAVVAGHWERVADAAVLMAP